MYDNGIPRSGWYFNNISDRSYSWSGVPNLHDFLVNSYGNGPHGREIDYSDIVNNNYVYVTGDLIQYNNGSKWSHTSIITGFRQKTNNVTIPLVTYRSSVTSRAVNADYDYYPDLADLRIILLDGYYPQ